MAPAGAVGAAGTCWDLPRAPPTPGRSSLPPNTPRIPPHKTPANPPRPFLPPPLPEEQVVYHEETLLFLGCDGEFDLLWDSEQQGAQFPGEPGAS